MRLGVLIFTSCSEGRGGGDGGFKRVEFSEALLALPLNGNVEDISLSMEVLWRTAKGLLNWLEKETERTKKHTVCHFAHRPDPHRPHRCIYTRWYGRHEIRPSLPPRGERDPSGDKSESNYSSR